MAYKKKDDSGPITAKPPVGQRQLLYFGKGTDRGDGQPINPPSADDIRDLLRRDNPDGPFNGYIGNDEAIEALSDVLFDAHLKPNHCAGPNGLALIGPASTGKTTLARMMGRGLGTTLLGNGKVRHGYFPFVECDRSIRNTGDLLSKMREVYRSAGVPLVATSGSGSGVEHYKAPPSIIYFDEAQALRGDWLLKATERNDATLITDDAVVDCKNVLWIISTTHRGKLPKAFDTRFMKVFLYPYTLDEVSTIVQVNNVGLDPDVCRMIAGYGGRVPREALDFAKAVKLAAQRVGSSDWKKVCMIVGTRMGVDEEGFNRQHLLVLVSLYNNREPMSIKRLSDQVNIEETDLEEYVLPPLQVQTADRNPLIRTSSRGLYLTEDGVAALAKRSLLKKKVECNGRTPALDSANRP